ncbi:MAG: NRDE family protein [Cyclobacteriaceae bacterium]
MCLIFLALNQHPAYKLIVAANRDEFYARKTAPAQFWEDYPHILGGLDLEASGTWMAMNRNGKISLVTNYRDPANINPNAPSRGQLVSDFLVNGDTPEEYLNKVSHRAAQYNGFNLLTGYPDELWYFSNYGQGIQRLESGIYGLSNHLLDTPWPKVHRGKEKFGSAIGYSVIEPDTLFELLYDEQRAEDQLLPNTGIGLDRERALSSMFIKTNGYGTRCSTVILVSHDNQVLFSERVYDLDTFAHKTNRFQFTISND